MSPDFVTDAEPEANTRRLLQEMWSDGRLEVADELISPSLRGRLAAFGEFAGPEGVKDIVSAYRNAFPDLRIEIEQMIVHGGVVVSRWRASGTHRGELLGLAPTEKKATITGITMDTWRDGRVVDTWTESDQLLLLQQLGVMPAPGTLGDRFGKRLQHLSVRTRRLRERGTSAARERLRGRGEAMRR